MDLEQALEAFVDDDAWETRLVLRSEADKLLLFRRAGEPQYWLELGHGWSSSERRQALLRLGLSRKRWRDGAKAWGRTYDRRVDTDALADSVEALWKQAYGDRSPAIELLSQREEPPENPALLDAIRAAARTQDEPTRKALYAALVNATLLVPIDPATLHADAAEQRPRSFGTDPGGFAMWAAFSDWDAIRQWQPDGHAFGPVHGAEFFAHVHDLGRCGVRINPDGVVGGELYPDEVAMMVAAVRDFYRRTMS